MGSQQNAVELQTSWVCRLSPKPGDALNVGSSAVTTITVGTDVTAGTEVPNDTVGTVVTADTVGTLYRCKQDGFAYRHLSWWRTITCVIQPPVGVWEDSSESVPLETIA